MNKEAFYKKQFFEGGRLVIMAGETLGMCLLLYWYIKCVNTRPV